MCFIRYLERMGESADGLLDEQLIEQIAAEIAERESDLDSLGLRPGEPWELRAEPGSNLSRLLERFDEHIQAGGIQVMDLDIRGQPSRFVLKPTFDRDGLGVQLLFQFRF